MIVAVTYLFHDNEVRVFVMDTAKLRTSHNFENAMKKALEGNRQSVTLNGNEFNDNWGNLEAAMVPCNLGSAPVSISALRVVKVDFEG